MVLVVYRNCIPPTLRCPHLRVYPPPVARRPPPIPPGTCRYLGTGLRPGMDSPVPEGRGRGTGGKGKQDRYIPPPPRHHSVPPVPPAPGLPAPYGPRTLQGPRDIPSVLYPGVPACGREGGYLVSYPYTPTPPSTPFRGYPIPPGARRPLPVGVLRVLGRSPGGGPRRPDCSTGGGGGGYIELLRYHTLYPLYPHLQVGTRIPSRSPQAAHLRRNPYRGPQSEGGPP